MTGMFYAQFTSSPKNLRSVGSLFTLRKGQNELLRAYITWFKSTNTNVRDSNPDIAIEAFKAVIRDQFTSKIISGSSNSDLNGAYKVVLPELNHRT